MTREEFYKTAKVMDEVKNIVRTLEVIDLHLLGYCTSGHPCGYGNTEGIQDGDIVRMIQGLFRDDDGETMGVLVPNFLEYSYLLENAISHSEKEIKVGDKNLIEAVKERSLETFAPEEMFVARDKFLNNLKKALEEVLAAIQLPKAEEKNKNCIDNDKNVK